MWPSPPPRVWPALKRAGRFITRTVTALLIKKGRPFENTQAKKVKVAAAMARSVR